MMEFFSRLADIWEVAVNFIVSFFQNLVFLIKLIPDSITGVQKVLALMPPFLTVPIFAFLGISLVIAVLNKWG